ncbi:UNKNOWN [Stylonychia lemnae]|uniref:Uncharacterized protein n=1 Tax=Stylonychia lemnae TaxID=5949 RepID=A0A078A0U5_STYLE|nr:UNKNOWN [Stylonychia lemnae]|eukprot:CDW74409.1 UNKNOWN [Stylonychia lemnae]
MEDQKNLKSKLQETIEKRNTQQQLRESLVDKEEVRRIIDVLDENFKNEEDSDEYQVKEQRSRSKQKVIDSSTSSEVNCLKKSPQKQKIENLQDIINNLELIQMRQVESKPINTDVKQFEDNLRNNAFFQSFVNSHDKVLNKLIDQAQSHTSYKFKEDLQDKMEIQSPFRQAQKLIQKKIDIKQIIQLKNQQTKGKNSLTNNSLDQTQSRTLQMSQDKQMKSFSRQDVNIRNYLTTFGNTNTINMEQSMFDDSKIQQNLRRERMNSYSRWLNYADMSQIKSPTPKVHS